MKRLFVYIWILNLMTGCNRPEQKMMEYSSAFSSKDGQVYYDGKPIHADATTFECIKDEYGKDKDHIYFGPIRLARMCDRLLWFRLARMCDSCWSGFAIPTSEQADL